jgi:hypothetical protein
MPIALINLMLVWAYLGFLHLRGSSSSSASSKGSACASSGVGAISSCEITSSSSPRESQAELDPSFYSNTQKSSYKIGLTLRAKLEELGSMTFHEKAVCVLFAVAVSLWFTRDPQIFRGNKNINFYQFL